MKNKETVTVLKSDLRTLVAEFDGFVVESQNGCDVCEYCGERYGNAAAIKAEGGTLTHRPGCPCVVAEKISDKLLGGDSAAN